MNESHAESVLSTGRMDFGGGLAMVKLMQYRIEMSTSREGVAHIHLPGRSLELEARGTPISGWQVAVVDPQQPARSPTANTVALFANSANDAVWRVARAAVRAVSELTNTPLDDELRHEPDPELPSAP
jgi:hypothetical protein